MGLYMGEGLFSLKSGVTSGGGGGAIIDPLVISENGTYTASGDIDGYSPVTANIPTGPARSSSDLTVSGATVTVPAGLYSLSASKSVAAGSAGTPIASKGTVTNHSVTVTPSVTNTTGYITGDTKVGTGVTVAASELVSGSETKTKNGTYDVTNLASLVVDVPSGGGGQVIAYTGTCAKTTNKTSFTATNVQVTIPEDGNYKFTWQAYAAAAGSSTYNYSTRLYNGATAIGSSHYCTAYNSTPAAVTESNITNLKAGDIITVYARTRSGTSYYTVVQGLIAEKIS